MITCQNLSKEYHKSNQIVKAMNDINISFNEGTFTGIMGPSGCGKSSLLLSIGGMIKPSKGNITIDDQDLYKLSPKQRGIFRANHIGFLFQAFHLIPYLNVEDNILSGALPSKKSPRQEAKNLLEVFQLEHRANHKPSELSTGEKQRTALARALVKKPKYLLADEPTGNLDPENAKIVLNQLRKFCQDGGTVIMVTHQQQIKDSLDHTIYLKEGQIA